MPRLDRRNLALLVASAAALLVAGAVPAGAHTGSGIGATWSGLVHPLLGPDHVFAMMSVGALAALVRRPFAVPVAFVSAMVLGGALGMAGMALPGGEPAIAVSVVALGAALVAGGTTHVPLALGLVACAGFVHGHAHGLEAPRAAAPIAYIAGFVAATAALHVAGVGVGQVLARRPAARAALGSVVLGAGVAFAVGVA